MPGHFSLILHAHLPYVRHPEDERFLEESWFYEAVTECYLPLLERALAWERDHLNARFTLVMSPTLCAMLLDPLLGARYERRLNGLIEFAEREVMRTRWEPPSGAWRSFTGSGSARCGISGSQWTGIWCGPSAVCRSGVGSRSSPVRRRMPCCRCWPRTGRRCVGKS